MLDFDNLIKKIDSMSQEELREIAYSALDASGIKYKKGNNSIIFNGLYGSKKHALTDCFDECTLNIDNNKYNLDEFLFVA